MTVELANGEYPHADSDHGSARLRQSGAPVTWRAAAGAKPVIAGRRVLAPSWSIHSGQIQVATVGAGLDFDQLFGNGSR